MKNYSELKQLKTYDERFNYLLLKGNVGKETFGFDRYLTEEFYNSAEWKRVRDLVIVRDSGCDLGVPGHEILGRIYIHHISPLTRDDIKNKSFEKLLDPENLICVSYDTHNAIHYGNSSFLDRYKITERTKNDTCPWKN